MWLPIHTKGWLGIYHWTNSWCHSFWWCYKPTHGNFCKRPMLPINWSNINCWNIPEDLQQTIYFYSFNYNKDLLWNCTPKGCNCDGWKYLIENFSWTFKYISCFNLILKNSLLSVMNCLNSQICFLLSSFNIAGFFFNSLSGDLSCSLIVPLYKLSLNILNLNCWWNLYGHFWIKY